MATGALLRRHHPAVGHPNGGGLGPSGLRRVGPTGLRLVGWRRVLRLCAVVLLLTACGGTSRPGGADGGSTGGVALAPSPARSDLPLANASLDQLRAFRA